MMPLWDEGENYLLHGRATEMWAIGDALYFAQGVTEKWQMRPAIDSDAPYPHLKHEPGKTLLVRLWPKNTIFHQAAALPPNRRKLTPLDCAWAVKRELRRNGEIRRIVSDFDAGKTPRFG